MLAHPGCNKWVTPQTSCDTNACLLLYFLLELRRETKACSSCVEHFSGNHGSRTSLNLSCRTKVAERSLYYTTVSYEKQDNISVCKKCYRLFLRTIRLFIVRENIHYLEIRQGHFLQATAASGLIAR